MKMKIQQILDGKPVWLSVLLWSLILILVLVLKLIESWDAILQSFANW
jgi:hypothetical protein